MSDEGIKLRVVDDMRDYGFGGHWGIAVLDEDGYECGEYLGDDRLAAMASVVAAAQPFAMYSSSPAGLAFQNKKLAQKAMAAARRALRAPPPPRRRVMSDCDWSAYDAAYEWEPCEDEFCYACGLRECDCISECGHPPRSHDCKCNVKASEVKP